VVALDGDGAALMRMGAFATVRSLWPPNLRHLLLDNGAHDSTGGQATVSPNVSFAQVARRLRLRGVARNRCFELYFRLAGPPAARRGHASRAC